MSITISDRITRVQYMLGNRTDLATRISGWLKEAYLELGMAYKFEELEDTIVSTTQITTSPIEVYNYPIDTHSIQIRAIKSMKLILSTGESQPLTRKNIKQLDKYHTTTPGIPSVYAPFKHQVHLRPIPDDVYVWLWRVWRKPYINAVVNSTVIELPDDWLEILDYSAAIRGHAELLEPDKAAALMQLLHGSEDPRTGRRVPGLIAQKLLLHDAESEDEDYQVGPEVRSYS